MVQILPTTIKTQNASYELTYTDGVLTTVTKLENGVTKTKDLTYADGVLTNVSKWEVV